MSGQEFLALPVELIVAILTVLDIQSIIRCRQICRFFRNVIDNAVDLQYKIHLVVAFMDDGPPSDLGSSQRLAILKDHQKAWNNLAWKEETSVSICEGCWELLGGVLGLLKGAAGRSITFRRLPSVFRGIEDMEWTIEDIGFKVADFSIDPSQDLLVAIEVLRDQPTYTCRVHLRSLTGDPHPSVLSTNALPFSSEFINIFGRRYSIQVYADLVGVLFQQPDGELDEPDTLVIWDWTTAKVKMWLLGNLQSFSFLTHNLIAVTFDAELRIYDIHLSPAQPTHVGRARFLSSFYFPAFSNGGRSQGVEFVVQTAPASSWPSDHLPNVPFLLSQSDKLVVVTCFTTRIWPRRVRALLLAPLSTLLNHININRVIGVQRRIPWKEWGPDGTRMMALSTSDVWVCSMQSMKLVVLNRRREVEMYDFNPLSLKRILQWEKDTKEEYSVENVPIDESEDSEDGHVTVECLMDAEVSDYMIFEKPVTTRLPCQKTTARLPRRSAEEQVAAMLTDDSLAIVYRSGTSRNTFRILTF